MPVQNSELKLRTVNSAMRRFPSAALFTRIAVRVGIAVAQVTSMIRIPEKWYQRSTVLKSCLAFGAFLIHLGTIGHWWLWWKGQTPLHVPVFWTAALVLLAITWPRGRRRDILGYILAGYVFYGVKGVFLDHLIVVGICMLAGAVVLLGLLVATAPPGYFKS